MIDLFSLGLSHGLMLIAAWRLLMRGDLDDDRGPRVRLRGRFRKDRPGA